MPAYPPVLTIYYGLYYENSLDIVSYVKELKITHEDIDAEKSGRDKKTGIMKRSRVNIAHTLDVTLRRVYQDTVTSIQGALQSYPRYKVQYRSPCGGLRTRKAYTSTINFGAQRYDRNTGMCYYDGVNFKMIEWGGENDDTGGSE